MSRRALFVISAAVTAAALAAGLGLRWLQSGTMPPGTGAPQTAAAAQEGQTPAKGRYHCPMHPTMVSDQPGNCPICQMRMVPIDGGKDAAEAAEPAPAAPSFFSPGKKVIYRSTMNPNEISDHPGKDSMGMEMVPVEIEESAPGHLQGLSTVNIPTRKQQLIGVRTSVVRRAPFVRTIRTVGRVSVDETRLHHAHTKIEGWIERLNVNATGEQVRRGQPLLSIYSPELVATQEEYLLALRTRRSMDASALPEAARRAEELVASARRRLLLYDLTPEQIRRLEETGEASRTVTLYAPLSGVVLERKVTHGEKIDPSMTLISVADLSRVWVIASVYEYELPFVKVGEPAVMTLSYLPGRTYRGRVAFVYPVLEDATRTVQVRLEFDNPGLDLKPDMYAHVDLQSDMGEKLTIPESAVLSSGTRDIVFVAAGNGYFEPREVRLGLRMPEAVEVLSGLAEGELVVTSGNFFIDSESKLWAALEAASGPTPGPGAQTQSAPPAGPQSAPSQTQTGREHEHP